MSMQQNNTARRMSELGVPQSTTGELVVRAKISYCTLCLCYSLSEYWEAEIGGIQRQKVNAVIIQKWKALQQKSTSPSTIDCWKLGEYYWHVIIWLHCPILFLFPRHVLWATVKDRMLSQWSLQSDLLTDQGPTERRFCMKIKSRHAHTTAWLIFLKVSIAEAFR